MRLDGLNLSDAALERVRALRALPQAALDSSGGRSAAQAAKEMERLFATQLVKELRKALPNGFFGQGTGSDIFEGWLDEQLGNSLAESGALDLAGRIRISIEEKEARRRSELAQGEPTVPNFRSTKDNERIPSQPNR